jgi:hypothetical protein
LLHVQKEKSQKIQRQTLLNLENPLILACAICKKILHPAENVKKTPAVVVVTNTFLPVEENPFPEKLKKAQKILSKTKFLDS